MIAQQTDWKPFKLDDLGTVGRGKSKHRPRNDPSLYGGDYATLDNDNFPNEDKLALHLDNLIKVQLGGAVFACLKTKFGEIGGKRFLAIECSPSNKPVFLKSSSGEEFFIRAGASSPALPASHMHEYIQQHFK